MEIEIKIEPGRILPKIIIVAGKVDKDTEALTAFHLYIVGNFAEVHFF